MASGKMKSFSSVGKLLIRSGMLSTICTMPPAMAGDFISGAQLKDHVRSVLMLRGVEQPPGDFGHPPVSRLRNSIAGHANVWWL